MLLRRLFCVLILLGTALPLCAETPSLGQLRAPLLFEPNRGQAASSVRFLSRGNGHSFLLADKEAVLLFADSNSSIRMKLVGQSPDPVINGLGLQRSVTNYFHGNDAAQWIRQVPQFEKVRYQGVYSGIDVVYYGNDRQLEYDFEVQPFANPSVIEIAFEGASNITIGPDGDLILSTPGGEIRHRTPIAFQRRGNDQRPVEAHFVLKDGHVGFQLGRYDKTLPLTIDPKLVWSSYLGGTGDDQGNDVTVDSAGNVYITGYTQTVTPTDGSDPPPAISLTPEEAKGFEGFVTKLDPTGAIVFTTYFGGGGVDEAHSLALDSVGNIFVTGYTTSGDFPVANPFQKDLAGVQDAYILKLSNGGNAILFSSYLGGSRTDRAFGIAVDQFGNAYVAGSTFGNVNGCTSDFPISNAFQPKYGGNGPGCGLGDAFLTKVTPAGTIGFSTFLGGGGNDQAYDVAIDSEGSIILTGFTSSQNFPTANPIFANFRGGTDDIFVTKFNSSGTSLVFSTYWGGVGSDNGVRLAVDSSNNIYVTGVTQSVDFPIKNPAQILHAGAYDAFLIKFHPDGKDVDFSTFIGGEDTESGVSIAVDSSGFIYIAGFTNSLQFYAINAVSGFLHGLRDGFVLKLNPDSSALVYSTYLGGFGFDGATAVAVDSAGNAYVVGNTSSVDFPVASNAFQSTNAGRQDGFIVKINADDVKTSESYSFAAGGGVRTATAGQTASPIFGYAAVDVAAGSLPSGLSIIDLRSSGTLINEVSVPIPPQLIDGRFYAETSGSSSTALTIVNPHDEDVAIDFRFTTAGGAVDVSGGFTLPAHAQVSGFLTGAPYNLPGNLIGVFSYTAAQSVAATALLVTSSGAALNVYQPIMNLHAIKANQVVIPQWVDGFGWRTQFFVVNPTANTITGQIHFFKNADDPTEPGVPATLDTDVASSSVIPYSIEPGGSFAFTTQGNSPQMTVGFAQVIPSAGELAPLAYGTLSFSGNELMTGNVATTVEGVQEGTEFKAYVEIVGTYPDNPLDSTLGLALANTSGDPVTVTLTMTGFDGTDSGKSANITLPPKGHLSKFLGALPGFENLPTPYAGVLKVTAPQPVISIAAFRARYNEQGLFLVTQTGPLKDVSFSPGVPPPNPVIVPHLVDGGGFATQIIVINGTSGAGASGAIRYLNPSGKPLNLGIAPQ